MSFATSPDHHTAIVGAGFSGIGAAVKLVEAGLDDYVIIEAVTDPAARGIGTRIRVSPLTSPRSRTNFPSTVANW